MGITIEASTIDAAIDAFGSLGDDAFQPEPGRMLEEQSAIAIDMIAELDG